MSDLPEPLTPPGCDLRDFKFMPVDVGRLLRSESWVLGTPDERSASIALWFKSWHEVPAASMPDNDRMLGHMSEAKSWKKVKDHALRGWIRCSDGRLYHPVVAEKALEAWIEKLLSSYFGSKGNASKWDVVISLDEVEAKIKQAASMLRSLEPQSKTLKKQALLKIVSPSPPDGKKHRPAKEVASGGDSPNGSGGESGGDAFESSGGDRNRQGQGQGLLKPSPSGQVIGTASRELVDEKTPKNEAEWLKHMRDKHGFEADPSSIHDRKKLWPVFAAWCNAGITTRILDECVATARRKAKGPIGNLVLYVDSVVQAFGAERDSFPSQDQLDADNAEAKRLLFGATGAIDA